MLDNFLDKYQVQCSIFIEELEHSESSFLYKKLSPLYQPVFDEHQRFVFLNFAPVQKQTLDHVVATLNYIDISPYFVLVITDQESTIEYFGSLPEPITTVRRIGEQYVLPSISTVPVFNTQNKMCAHAWSGLHIFPNGDTALCCEYKELIKDQQGQPYNLKHSSIQNILDSEYIKQIRQQFRSGVTPTGCSSCEKIEALGAQSKRSMTPFKLQNIYGKINWESDQSDSIGFIGGHLGNLCNLKCRICSERFSSSIASEKIKFSLYKDKKQDPVYQAFSNSWANYIEEFYKNLKQMVPPIQNFEFLGGEPLLIKENLEFMQYLLDTGLSKDCIFEFTTNGTQYPEIFNHADQFKRLTVTLSIDNLGEKFELERSGSQWSTVESNIEKFINRKNSCSSMEIGVSITVNIQNVYYLPELVRWLTHKGVSHYYYNWLTSPAWLSLDSLTAAAKTMVIEKLSSTDFSGEDQQKLNTVINKVTESLTSDGRVFCEEMKKLDLIRSQTFDLTHKEIAKAMGYAL